MVEGRHGDVGVLLEARRDVAPPGKALNGFAGRQMAGGVVGVLVDGRPSMGSSWKRTK